jgi:hypothetical protein
LTFAFCSCAPLLAERSEEEAKANAAQVQNKRLILKKV